MNEFQRLIMFLKIQIQNFGTLTVKLPDTMPTEYVNCLALELK